LIVTAAPEIVTSTPVGTASADFPMRDILFLRSTLELPHETHDFATNVALARFAVGHESVTC